jgi:hypothetical protein
MAKHFRCSVKLSLAGATPMLVTHHLFDAAHKDAPGSPLDEFLVRLSEINVLCPPPNQFNSFQGQLILLGTISAVESYIRTLFRRLIRMDPVARDLVQHKDVSYGAALHLPKELMPEAILERISFVSKTRVTEALRDLLGVKGNLPSELEASVDAYGSICQLRNCVVHRFGKLGSRNAIELGLEKHGTLMEKPLKLDYVSVQNSIAIATGFVKTLNNFLFNEMLTRLPTAGWSGDYRKDGPRFREYYHLFSDRTSSTPSPTALKAYGEFKAQLKVWTLEAAKAGRGAPPA